MLANSVQQQTRPVSVPEEDVRSHWLPLALTGLEDMRRASGLDRSPWRLLHPRLYAREGGCSRVTASVCASAPGCPPAARGSWAGGGLQDMLAPVGEPCWSSHTPPWSVLSRAPGLQQGCALAASYSLHEGVGGVLQSAWYPARGRELTRHSSSPPAAARFSMQRQEEGLTALVTDGGIQPRGQLEASGAGTWGWEGVCRREALADRSRGPGKSWSLFLIKYTGGSRHLQENHPLI